MRKYKNMKRLVGLPCSNVIEQESARPDGPSSVRSRRRASQSQSAEEEPPTKRVLIQTEYADAQRKKRPRPLRDLREKIDALQACPTT